jgi:hypothetical protein
MTTFDRDELYRLVAIHSDYTSDFYHYRSIVNFDTLSKALLGPPLNSWGWCYYNDPEAHDLFDQIMALGCIHYYASPKESFQKVTACQEAYDAGCVFVLLEDMS